MVDIAAIKQRVGEKGMTLKILAIELGMKPQVLYNKLNRGQFVYEDIKRLQMILQFDDPWTIFFS